jgi:hypothetical protein
MIEYLEMLRLEKQGEPVNWPEGINARIVMDAIFDFFSPMIECDSEVEDTAPTPPPAAGSSAPPPSSFGSNQDPPMPPALFADLIAIIELEDSGEAVVFPPGYTSADARQAVAHEVHRL